MIPVAWPRVGAQHAAPLHHIMCPLQWRGRAGVAPASVSPFAMNYALSLGRETSMRKVRGTWCVVRGRRPTQTTHYAPRTGFFRNAHTSALTIAIANAAMTYGSNICG